MLLLDINDTEITLNRDGEVLYTEPGIALVERGGAQFGGEASSQSRLHPRQTHNEFWQRLNADPVSPAGRGVANQADLVYLQLRAIREATGLDRADLVVAAPSTTTPAQLGLLLGIAAEAGFDVRAVVDAAVAAASTQSLTGSCRFVDVGLHRAFVTQIDLQDGETVTRGTVDEVPAAGFAALVEGWVDTVADNFVETTRFDPLRIAATEQQVFDQLLAGVQSNSAEITVAVEHDGVSRDVNISRRALSQKSQQRYGLLATAVGAPSTLLVSHRVRRLPGVTASLQEAGHQIVALPAEAVASAVQRHGEVFAPDAGGAKLISSLALLSAPAESAAAQRAQPTHLLCGAQALPLADEVIAGEHPASTRQAAGFRILKDGAGFRVVPNADAQVRFNGEPLDFDRPVHAGDRIESDGDEFQLIRVVAAER